MSGINLLSGYNQLSPDLKLELDKFRQEIADRTKAAETSLRVQNEESNFANVNNEALNKVRSYQNLELINNKYNQSPNSNIRINRKNLSTIQNLAKAEENRSNLNEELDIDFLNETNSYKGLVLDAKI